MSVSAHAPAPISLVATGAVWKYNDSGADLSNAWRTLSYNDAAWFSGPAQLGFGDGDEATLVASNQQVTTYFRRTFTVGDPWALTNLTVRVLRDDGAIVYLNNVEVFRSNLPGGTASYLTPALGAVPAGDETTNFYSTNINATLLVPGTNVLAVEVHQNISTSSDVSFDLSLEANCLVPRPPLALTARSGNLHLNWPASGAFALWSAPSVMPPGAWTRDTNTPVFTNWQWSLVLPSGSSNRFYRLRAE